MKIYFHRSWASARGKQRAWPYQFVLFDPIDESLAAVELDFNKSTKVYNWNQLDNMICGYVGDVTSLVRSRRQIFGIMPLSYGSIEKSEEAVNSSKKVISNKFAISNIDEETSVICSFEKFVAWIQSRLTKGTMTVNIRRRFTTRDKNEGHSSSVDDSEKVGEKRVEIIDDKTVFDPIPVPTKMVKIDLQSNKTGRYEWIQLEYDSIFCPYQCYHLQVHWMVASGASVNNEFVSVLYRKAKQAGLTFYKFPEYCLTFSPEYEWRVPHSFVLPEHITVEKSPQQEPKFFDFLRKMMEEKLDFVVNIVRVKGGKRRNSGEVIHGLVHKSAIAFVYISGDGKIE